MKCRIVFSIIINSSFKIFTVFIIDFNFTQSNFIKNNKRGFAKNNQCIEPRFITGLLSRY
jgi:hypothetical protein